MSPSTPTIDVKVTVTGLAKLTRALKALDIQLQIATMMFRGGGYRAERRREELRLELAQLRQRDDPFLHVDLVTVCTPTGTVCRVRTRRLGGWTEAEGA
jgi:acetoin utilization deacetylase AcuC-like enzyme